jgi:hypothetical protein
MAIYPNGIWRPLPENQTQPRITPRVVILHTAVSTASSLYSYYNSPGVNLESQFYVSQNQVEQYVDTTRQADANRYANPFAISIETWDNRQAIPWTPLQMDMLVDLVAWCCVAHGIPARQCPAWDASGIGWHVMFGAPGPWTPVNKSCPGGPHIAQMPELIARVQQVITNPVVPPIPVDIGGDLGMDGIFHDGVIHIFSVRDDGALIERWGDPSNPAGVTVVMPPGWCRPGAEARVKVIDVASGYGVAALRGTGDIANWAYWTGAEWVLKGWPP